MAEEKQGSKALTPEVLPDERSMPPAEDEMESLGTVGGHKIRPIELEAFQLYCKHTRMTVVSRQMGGRVTAATLNQWRRTEWWQALHRAFIENRQADFMTRVMSESDAFADAALRIVKGEHDGVKADPALVSSQEKMVSTFAKMGDKPIIDQRSKTTVNQNTINNYGSIDVTRVAQEASQDDLLQMTLNGRIPDQFKQE